MQMGMVYARRTRISLTTTPMFKEQAKFIFFSVEIYDFLFYEI